MKKKLLYILLLLSICTFSQGSLCFEAEPFCSNATLTFPNTFNGSAAQNGPDYDCLSTAPNPSWYFLGIDVAGDLNISISQRDLTGALIDVDFICYGPFNDVSEACVDQLILANVVDCSYLPDEIEYLDIANAQIGTFYIILITNFSNQEGNISIEQTNIGQGGAGSTDCSVVCDIALPEDQQFCNINEYQILATLGNDSVEDTTTFRWYKNDVLIDGENSISLAINTNVSTTDTYKIIASSPICDEDSEDEIVIAFSVPVPANDPTIFFVNPEPDFLIDETVVYCQDNHYPNGLTLSIDIENNNIDDFSFSWSTGQTSLTILVNLEDDYQVEILNSQNCTLITKTFHVIGSSVFSSTEPNFVDEETYYCLNTYPDNMILNHGIENNLASDYTIQWFNEAGDLLLDYPNIDFNPNLEINEAGIYEVKVLNADNCFVSRQITVVSSDLAKVNKVLITDTNFNGLVSAIVEIQVQENDHFEYGIDLNNPEDENTIYQEENTFDNLEYGFHTFYIRDKNGCGVVSYEVFFLEYPKFITPNNDGNHDTWNINNTYAYQTNVNVAKFNNFSDVTIFDRYGKVMAVINPRGNGWDGNFLGKPVPSSDYWFMVELTDYSGNKIIKEGHFVLER